MITLEKLLGAVLEDPKAMLTLRGAVTDELVIKNPHYRSIMEWAVEFKDKYNKLPSDQDAHVWFLTLPEARQYPLKSAWKALKSQDYEGYTLEFLAETGLEELRNVAARNASRLMAAAGEQVDPQMLQEFNDRIKNIRPVEITDIANLSDIGKWARPKDKTDIQRWTTGIPKLDKSIGGFQNDLVFVMAESGKGKTSLLVNLLKAAVLEGATGLHISLEVDLHALAGRYYKSISEASTGEYHHNLEGVRKRLDRWFSFARGNIFTKYAPAYSLTVDDIRTLVNVFIEKEGSLDYVVLDYLDLVKRTPEQSRLPRDEQERRLAHEIRTICTEHEIPVVSAAQATLEGYDQDLSLRHMGGGAAKIQAADMIFGLMQNEDESMLNQGRLRTLKVRESGGRSAEIPLHMDLDKMLILDLDDPNARRLRQKDGVANG